MGTQLPPGRDRGAGRGGRPRSPSWPPRPRRNLAPSGGRAGAPIAAAPPARPPPRAPPTSRPARGRRPAPRGVPVPPPPPRAGGWGRGRPRPTGPENKAAAAAALTFSVSAPRSPRRLLTEEGSAVREKLRARPALGSRTRRQRGFTRLAGSRPPQAPLPPASSLLPPPRPVLKPEGGGPGRAGRGRARGGGARPARGLPGAVVSRRGASGW